MYTEWTETPSGHFFAIPSTTRRILNATKPKSIETTQNPLLHPFLYLLNKFVYYILSRYNYYNIVKSIDRLRYDYVTTMFRSEFLI